MDICLTNFLHSVTWSRIFPFVYLYCLQSLCFSEFSLFSCSNNFLLFLLLFRLINIKPNVAHTNPLGICYSLLTIYFPVYVVGMYLSNHLLHLINFWYYALSSFCTAFVGIISFGTWDTAVIVSGRGWRHWRRFAVLELTVAFLELDPLFMHFKGEARYQGTFAWRLAKLCRKRKVKLYIYNSFLPPTTDSWHLYLVADWSNCVWQLYFTEFIQKQNWLLESTMISRCWISGCRINLLVTLV